MTNQGERVDLHTVLIISEHKTDHLILSACLERAAPKRFRLASPNLIRRPLEALLDPSIDAVIMAYGPETEYLLSSEDMFSLRIKVPGSVAPVER